MKKFKTGMLALSFFAFLYGCGKPKDLEFINYRNVSLEDILSGQPQLNAELVYFNPNNYRIYLKDAKMDVFLNSNLLGHYDRDSLFTIPARDTFYFPFKMRLDVGSILNNFLGHSADSLSLKAVGNCKVGRNGVFFNLPFSYTMKGLPGISL